MLWWKLLHPGDRDAIIGLTLTLVLCIGLVLTLDRGDYVLDRVEGGVCVVVSPTGAQIDIREGDVLP